MSPRAMERKTKVNIREVTSRGGSRKTAEKNGIQKVERKRSLNPWVRSQAAAIRSGAEKMESRSWWRSWLRRERVFHLSLRLARG